MKLMLLILISMISLNALELNFTTFQANFKQTITDEKGKELIYSGEVKLKDNQHALWAYKKPIVKEVYFVDEIVSVVESDLEQVIIKELDNEIDLQRIIKNAVKIDAHRYEADSYNKKYILSVENQKIVRIDYKDEFDNHSKIEFTNIVLNKKLSDGTFKYTIPEDFDVIR